MAVLRLITSSNCATVLAVQSANFAPCRILSPNSAVIVLAGSDQDASRLWRSGRPNPTDKPHLFLAGRVRCHHNDLPFPRAKAEH